MEEKFLEKEEVKSLADRNKFYFKKPAEGREVLLNIKDATGREFNLSVPEKLFTTIKYAGEGNGITYDSAKESFSVLDEGEELVISQLGKDLEEGESINPLGRAFQNLIQDARDKISLNIAFEWLGGDKFRLREEFKRDFNWKEVGPILEQILSAEVGREVRIEEIDVEAALEHKERVFLDLSGLGAEVKVYNEERVNLRRVDCGSHIEFRQQIVKIALTRYEMARATFRVVDSGMDLNYLYDKAVSLVPEATRKAIGGDGNTRKVIESVVQTYRIAYFAKEGDNR